MKGNLFKDANSPAFFVLYFLEKIATLHPNDLICGHSQAADLGHNFFLEAG